VTVEHVEVLVEELSAEAALRLLLPKILKGISFEIHPHQGKADLLKDLPGRLRGYAQWLPHTWRILVLVDRDDDDCARLKADLEHIAAAAGHKTRTRQASDFTVVNRISIEELEAWFFGDWDAVRRAYPRVSKTIPGQARYRDPDAIVGTWEALERVLQRAGYFAGGLGKIQAARDVGAHMDPARNRSHSFRVFCSALEAFSGS